MKDIIEQIGSYHEKLIPGSTLHGKLEKAAATEAESTFSDRETKTVDFPPFGKLVFPYHQMGAISSVNLFHIDELVLFGFYWANRKRYRRVADVGANIGLHSILLKRAGYEVRAYEPDPDHQVVLQRNLKLNDCEAVQLVPAAVASQAGQSEFVQVLGNTTGSHLAGAKENPYGELVRIKVPVKESGEVMKWADLVKLDVEGQETDIILSTKKADWKGCDMLLEIGGEDNAKLIFDHLQELGVHMFTQKIGWRKAVKASEVPVSYHEGLAFISLKSVMPWGQLSGDEAGD